jgi:hypothetical protein
MSGPWPAVPGVPAAGHVTGGGAWHPGLPHGCVKCPPKRLNARGARPDSRGRRYRFSPIGGDATYRRGTNSVVTFVAMNGPGPRSDLWTVRFPNGTERQVAVRDLLSLQ